MKKICLRCHKKLLINCFYKCGGYYMSYCKICHKKRVNKNPYFFKKYGTYNARKTPYALKIRIRDKEYQRRKRKLNPEKKNIETRIYFEKYPERIRAMSSVQRAIISGKLKRDKCRDCDRLDVQGHHPNYNKPLEVIWLCPVHHKLEHLKIGSV